MSRPTITQANIFPRQEASTAVSSSSSFNWWPYPPGGVTTTSTPVAVASTTTSDTILSSSASSLTTTTNLSFSVPPVTTHSSAPSLIHVTALNSIPASLPSFGPQSPHRPYIAPLNPLWLIPICLLSGAVLGFAVGWLVWRYFGAKRKEGIPEGYAFAYPGERTIEKNEKDVERGHGPEYASLGRRPASHYDQGTERKSSHASTSGARTWMEHSQARKRSGAFIAPRINTGSRHEHGADMVNSPLLSNSPSLGADLASKPLPASPHPSGYTYEDEPADDIHYESGAFTHKNARQRLLERLGFGDGDIGRKKSRRHDGDGDGRNTWSVGTREEHAAGLGRSISLWGRRKTVKGGRVERWVRGVVDGTEVNIPTTPPDRHAEATDSLDEQDTMLVPGTPDLVLDTLRRVSLTPLHLRELDDDIPDVPGFEGKLPALYSSSRDKGSTSHHQNQTTPDDARLWSIQRVEQRPRGVSLQDPGPVSGVTSLSRSTVKKLVSTPRNTSVLHSTSSIHSSQSQRNLSNPMPPTPSSVSRYSVTPRTPALSTLNPSPTRTPSRSVGSRDLRASLSKAAPSSRIARSNHAAISPSRSSGTPPRTRTSPSRGAHTISQYHPQAALPAGPSSLMSPPLESALCFDATPQPVSSSSRAPAISRGSGATPSTSRTRTSTHDHSSDRISAPSSILSRPSPTRSTHPRASNQSTGNTPSPVTAALSISPKERHLARKNANARVGMILSRSYSSRNFDERPLSPTMFGAVINEDVEELNVDGDSGGYSRLVFDDDERGGIQQRLDRLRMPGTSKRY